MKKIFTLAVLLLTVANMTFAQTKVGMLVADDYTNSDDENSAVTWFQTTYTDGVLVTPSSLSTTDLSDVKTLWVACDRIGIAQGWANLPGNLAADATINALKTFVENGGNLLLTNHATQLTVAVGRISNAYAPGIFGSGTGGQNNDVWGSQPIIGNAEGHIYDHSQHPIYNGMNFTSGFYERSIYCFEGAGVKGDHNCMWDLNTYGLAPEPNVVKAWEDVTNSTVLGTWNHVVDYCCAGIVDFEPTTTILGRILAVGLASYGWNLGGGTNDYQDQLEMFTANCLTYLTEGGEETTGISQLRPDVADDGQIFTLDGRRVAQPKTGIYIKNNKKFVVK